MRDDLEMLAVQLAAMPNDDREWVQARSRDLLRVRRAMGRRLTGKPNDLFGRIVTGGFLYDADGNAVVRVSHLDMRRDVDKERTHIYITGHSVEGR